MTEIDPRIFSGRNQRILSVLIIDDHALVREGLKMLLESTPSIRIDGAVGTVNDALDFLNGKSVDVILLDLKLNGNLIIDEIPSIKAFAPKSRILVVTGNTNTEVHKTVVQKGASGVFVKYDRASLLIRAIEKVANGEVWVGRNVTSELLSNLDGRKPTEAESDLQRRISSLTPREKDIIKCLSSGVTNQGIGEILGITEKSVRNSLSNIFSKLLVTNRLELLLLSTKCQLDGSSERRHDHHDADDGD